MGNKSVAKINVMRAVIIPWFYTLVTPLNTLICIWHKTDFVLLKNSEGMITSKIQIKEPIIGKYDNGGLKMLHANSAIR